LLTIAALNMIISLYYYLKVVKAIFMDKNEQPIEKLPVNLYARLALLVCLAGIILLGLLSPVYDYIFSLSKGL
jgi:NADH-quinone oxidoreductase subunit N